MLARVCKTPYVLAHHSVDLGHVTSGHPLIRRKTKLLTIHGTLQRHADDIEESTDDSDVHMGNRRHFQNVGILINIFV
ncbi:hypothetical protein NC652_041273 [Populus alba x Populus x berolinensis]|nr:hypothetical protein NC652_041273 [Populus alba x Populus x berolinensis]